MTTLQTMVEKNTDWATRTTLNREGLNTYSEYNSMKKTSKNWRNKIVKDNMYYWRANYTCTIYVSIVDDMLWNMCHILWGQWWKVLNMRTSVQPIFITIILLQNVYCNLFRLIYCYFYIDEHKKGVNNAIHLYWCTSCSFGKL